MDTERFDRITRTFAARASRRRLMGGLVALGLGSGVLGPSRAGARRAGGSDRGGAAIEATDPICEGQVAANDRICSAAQCGSNCFCVTSVAGAKKCVDASFLECPPKDQCDRHRECGSGLVCVKIGGCCGNRRNVCLPRCLGTA